MNIWIICAAILVGYIIGGLAARFFFFPKNAGRMIISCDKSDGSEYVFFEAKYEPDQIRHFDTICVKIVDKTERG